MSTRELIVLSPYRLPTQHTGMFGDDDIAAWLNAYTCFWHPAAVAVAGSPARVASPYDHEQPTGGHIYALPESPPLMLPDDWDHRVREAGAAAFRATNDRAVTLENLKEALRSLESAEQQQPPPEPFVPWELLLNLSAEQVAPFLGIGFGYLHVEGLFEAMEHENLLATSELWQDLQRAVAALGTADMDACQAGLKSAAERLLAAREVLYPANLHLLDVTLLDDQATNPTLPLAADKGLPFNLIAAASVLEKLARERPELLTTLRERVANESAEVCGGPYVEREDALLPMESQLWNLLKGMAAYRDLLGQEIRVFARKRFAAHPQLPLLLNQVGLRRAVLLAFDDSTLPSHRSPVVNWPSPDGKQVEAFTRTPYAADSPQTYFHVAHYLHRTIMQDHGATLALLHRTTPAPPWYHDWLELSKLAPVLGRWTTFSRYFNDVLAGEYTSAAAADEFHGDYLSERTSAHSEQPVGWFARQVRWRRRLDTIATLAALHRGLAGSHDPLRVEARLAELEDRLEPSDGLAADDLTRLAADLGELQKEVAGSLADRLLSRATGEGPGYLLLNPCSFTRRVALELDGMPSAVPVTGPVKAGQLDGDKARLVVEVPPLGFAWFPASGAETTAPGSRLRLADQRGVRNEFFEAEVDPATGGLRALRDHRTRVNRIGQQLVYNPGSVMKAKEVRITSTGPALGEVVSEGAILDEHEKVLATFRQRFRAWMGRPLLDLRIEIYPEHLPSGYPWHAYYGARFAWRDERATLLRGVNGTAYVTSHTRPETPDFLEVRLGRQSTAIFPGGLPFHQRHGSRMLDIILVPEGETTRSFDLALGLDREQPMQTALGLVTPVPLVPTTKGPPHVGASGWLFHLDASNLLLTGMRPAPEGADGLIARLLECAAHPSQAEFRCARDPVRATLLDATGSQLMEATTHGDAVILDVSPGDLVQLRVDFS